MDIRHAWKLVLQETGLQDFRFHDLRHTFASYLVMNGASLVDLAEVLGHKSLTTGKLYAHLTKAHTTVVVSRMTAAIFP